MKPLINLKLFLAALLMLIVPAAVLVAYFRHDSPEAGGHEHREKGKGGGTARSKGDVSPEARGHDTMPKPQGGQQQPMAETSLSLATEPQKESDHAAMGTARRAGKNTAEPGTMKP